MTLDKYFTLILIFNLITVNFVDSINNILQSTSLLILQQTFKPGSSVFFFLARPVYAELCLALHSRQPLGLRAS